MVRALSLLLQLLPLPPVVTPSIAAASSSGAASAEPAVVTHVAQTVSSNPPTD